MKKDFFIKKILQNFDYEPTKDQKILIERLSEFIFSPENDELLLIKGYAGTGKTTVISAFVRALYNYEINFVLLAPTGRAAKVLSNSSKFTAYTIHKFIYRAKNAADPFTKFELDKTPKHDILFIVDEASMIANINDTKSRLGSGFLLDDLIDYVYVYGENCKLILIGDAAQLPPVSMGFSPALDKKYLQKYGLTVIEAELKEIVRQSLDSGILYNSLILRELIESGDQFVYPKFKTEGFDDFIPIRGSQLIENLTESYEKNGIEGTLVITYSNKQANRYNQGIRNAVFYREERITRDEILMIVKNNYFWTEDTDLMFLANGDMGIITQIFDYQDLYDYTFADVEMFFPDYNVYLNVKIILDTLLMNTPSMDYEEYRKFYEKVKEEYSYLLVKRQIAEKVYKNPYFQALQVKYGYAVTCHKAQGGQWNTVFVDQSYINENMLTTEYYRWLYTAITRATQRIFLVNFKPDFFQNFDYKT